MEKRYQVFVSSTYKDLKMERRAVVETLLEMDCIPTAMEFFSAADETVWATVESMLSICDYYVLIVGGRYGTTEDDGISYTEKEYDLAIKLGLPVLAFLHADPDLIPAKHTETKAGNALRLEAFRKKIGQHTLKGWTNPDALAGAVALAMTRALKRSPRPGWVRADSGVVSEEVYRKLAEAHEQITSLRKELAEAGYQSPLGANNLAQGDVQLSIDFDGEGCLGDDEYTWGGSVELSWDELFCAILPKAIVPAREGVLRSALDELVADHSKEPEDHMEDVSISIANDSWEQIKVQALALGLIEVVAGSTKRLDGIATLKLTPYGFTEMCKLIAVPAKSS